MRRGEVRWYTFKTPDKRRPVVILTRDSAIRFLNALTIAAVTTTVRDIPTEVYLSREDGLPEECVVNLDNIQTVPKAQVGDKITQLSPARMQDVNRALAFALGMDNP